MEKMEITWPLTLKIWWSFTWRATVFSVLLAVILGFFTGVVMAFLGLQDAIAGVSGALGYICSIPVSIWVMKTILEKQFVGYAIAVVKSTEP